MDFDDTPKEAEFRGMVRSFLADQATFLASTAGKTNSILNADLAAARRWLAIKADAGLAGILLPREYGGRGGTIMEQIILDQEEAAANAPSDLHFMIGMGICAPTLVRFGTEDQKRRHLPALIRGEQMWCQLFSEPSGGSDLAAARTRARRDGDDWIITGQKIWTSGAQHSDFGLLLARSDPSVTKHRGLTVFILDMATLGVEVRPIKQISGAAYFNEVFLDDVSLPDSRRLGEPGQGWDVAVAMLMNERMAAGRVLSPDVVPLIDLARRTELDGALAIDNGMVRERLAQWYCEQQGVKHTLSRVMTALSKGRLPGPEASIIKIVDAVREFEMASLALDLLGPAGGSPGMPGQPQPGHAIDAFLEAPGTRIAGGTEEILLNVIAERVLGLPADFRADKDLAFDQLQD